MFEFYGKVSVVTGEQLSLIFGGIQALVALLVFFGVDARILKGIGFQTVAAFNKREKFLLLLITGSLVLSGYGLYRSFTRSVEQDRVVLKGGFLQLQEPQPRKFPLFAVGETLSFNLYFNNRGAAPVTGGNAFARLWLVRGPANEKQDTTIFEKFQMDPDRLHKKTIKGVNIGVGDYIWTTVESDTPIKKDDYSDFLQGRLTVYILSYASWDGYPAGLDTCMRLQPPHIGVPLEQQQRPIWQTCDAK